MRPSCKGSRKLGWTDGRNVAIDYRFGVASDPNRSASSAAELVAHAPDVILACGTPTAVTAAAATRTDADRVRERRRPGR